MNSFRMDANDFLDRDRVEAHEALTRWQSAPELQSNLESEWDAFIQRVGVDREPLLLDIDGLGAAVAFRNADPRTSQEPYAVVRHRSFGIQTHTDAATLARALREAFGDSVSRGIVYEASPSTTEKFDASSALARAPISEPEKRYLAAPIVQLREATRPRFANRVVAERATDLSFYDEYSDAYDRFHEAKPELRTLVPKESLDDMRKYLEARGVYHIRVDGEWAGIIAATPDVEVGLRGWRFRERLLTAKFRGQKLGPASLDAFIRAIEAAPRDMLFGEIHAKNTPSYKSARALGRVDVGGWFWLDLPR
ncbi:MAG: hypothetical protein ACF8PN_00525 [Phycisphaerales bacterium]